MRDFRKLTVWERSYRLTLAAYRATANFPREELYGLTSQIRRSCAAIPANMAKGCGRGSNSELARLLQIASGSVTGLECSLLLARDLALLTDEEHERLAVEVTELKRMLTAFIKSLRAFGNQPNLMPETYI